MSNENIQGKIEVLHKYHEEIQAFRLSLHDAVEQPVQGEEANCEDLLEAEWGCLNACERLEALLRRRQKGGS